jgi:hypothetical protein
MCAHALRIAYCTPYNNTVPNIEPILSSVAVIIHELVGDLQGSGLGCTVQELLELVAALLEVLLPSSLAVFRQTLTCCGTDYPVSAQHCMRFKL